MGSVADGKKHHGQLTNSQMRLFFEPKKIIRFSPGLDRLGTGPFRALTTKAPLIYTDAPFHKKYALATFKHNYKWLCISLSAAPAPDGERARPTKASPLENRLIHALSEAVKAEEDEINGKFEDEYNYEDGWEKHRVLTDWVEQRILSLAGDLFDEKAPPVRSRPDGLSLQKLVWYDFVHLRLETIDGTPTILEISPDQAVCLLEPVSQPELDTNFKPDPRFRSYLAADIQVLQTFSSVNGPVCKVRVGGSVMMSKTPMRGLGNDDLKKEIATLLKIADAEEKTGLEIATPHFIGYVTHAETGVIIGFLREWINASRHGITLDDIPMAKMPLVTRQDWAEQIQTAMEDLHSIGLFWGDCKPANVIIDEREYVWLIDLGGNFTSRWVDKELTGTLAGDAQGLFKILQFLGLVGSEAKS